MKVCLAANALDYPTGGGHLWVALNWALGLRALGCEVVWLERARQVAGPAAPLRDRLTSLKQRLTPYGLSDHVAIWGSADEDTPAGAGAAALPANDRARALPGSAACRATLEGARPGPLEDADTLPIQESAALPLDAATDADLLLSLEYFTPQSIVERFRRSALLDIDPGLLQLWVGDALIPLARYDVHFTIGETVGRPAARFPDLGLRWEYTPPCVALSWWPVAEAAPDAPFTTLSHWWAGEWLVDGGVVYDNTKRAGFLPFLELPRRSTQPLELALYLEPHEHAERARLRAHGWRVRESADVAATPWDYQLYVQASRGEFSCAKPSCVRLQNAWISDRTLCYLASGKPAVVQHTGPSRFLPDAEGLFRFRDPAEAARALDAVAADYEHHCARARALAEEYFDARAVARSVLERALA